MSAFSRERAAGRDESGFTLIELLMVLVIIGVLLAIAVPSFLGFKDRAQKRAAASNVRTAIPDAETYYADNQTYAGVSLAALKAIDSGVAANLTVFGAATGYCISDQVGSHIAKVVGPAGTVDESAASACTSATG
jgi:type IV pilus assembly protein PilA